MKTIKVARKEEQGETYRYLVVGPRCTAAYFAMALQHVFGSIGTAGCALTLIDQAGKKVRFEALADGATYFVLFEGDGGSFQDEGDESELMDSQLQDSNRLKVLLPDAYLTLKISQVGDQASSLIKQLTFRLDYTRSQIVQSSQAMKSALGVASADFLAYAAEVNALSYRRTLIAPGLSEVVNEAQDLIARLKSIAENKQKSVERRPIARISPEKMPSVVITRKMMEEAGLSKEELKRFLRFSSRTVSEAQSEVQSHVTTPKAVSKEADLDRSHHDAKSVSGSDTSATRERKLLTRLRDKAKASETVLQNSIAAFLYEDSVVTRVQMTVSDGTLRLAGLGRGRKTVAFPLYEMESVKRSDEYERTLVVRFQDSKELKIGFTDDPTYHSWVGAFEDQMALIRGSLISPKKLKDGLS